MKVDKQQYIKLCLKIITVLVFTILIAINGYLYGSVKSLEQSLYTVNKENSELKAEKAILLEGLLKK